MGTAGSRPLTDKRFIKLKQWLVDDLGLHVRSLEPIANDASFRRYFRVHLAKTTCIVMDAPPAHEDCHAFVVVAKLLRQAGVNAPAVLEQECAQGLLLLTDLGRESYLDAIDHTDVDALFTDAMDALIRWQVASEPGRLPSYSQDLLQRELDLFPDWYLARHLGLELSATERDGWQEVCARLIDSALGQAAVYVHRDYMVRNLMYCEPNPGVIDFQDAVYGPVTYDIVSLLRDAFVSWESKREARWLRYYRSRAHLEGIPVAADADEFIRQLDWMGVQRHLKVIGIFARLCYRDGKARYLAETPRFFGYVRAAAARYSELGGLLKLLDGLQQRQCSQKPRP
ncbi:MAG: phosphotransferase [Nitrococcus mobilis]|nr:phosphotransferase [Nitrococcus mobilis]